MMKRSKHADIHMRIRSDRLCRSPINGGMSRRELCDLIASLEHDNDEMRKKLNALRAHDIEIVDGVAGGYEIYDARTKEIDRLLYENARLRSCISDDKENFALIDGENRDLRQLVCEMHQAINHLVMLGSVYKQQHQHKFDSIADSMRRLGFECEGL